MAITYNYTSVRKREKRKYSIMDMAISQAGILTKMIWVFLPLAVFFLISGLTLSIKLDLGWHNILLILDGETAPMWFYVSLIGIPYGISYLLFNYKISGYRLIDYLQLVIEPKTPIDKEGKSVKDSKSKFKSSISRLI